MTDRQFRFAYFTPSFDETVAFYGSLEMPVVEWWNRSPDDRGALIRAASGIIEVLARPNGTPEHLFDERPPQGAFMVIEVDEVEDLYDRARRANVPIPRELGKTSWGHLSFCVREPNGLTLYFFESLADASSV